MKSLLQHYLLANYGAGVQLSQVENERTFIVADVLLAFQAMYLYLSLFFLVFYRSVAFGYQLIGIGLVAWFLYKIVRPATHRYFRKAGLATVYRELSRAGRAAYAVTGCVLTVGGLGLIYAVLLYRQNV
jgi:hypothetical protein